MGRWLAAAVFLALLVLYVSTAQRGVSWQDSGEFQRRALLGDLAGVEGVARAHPLYVAALHTLVRVCPPACTLWAVNAFSGLGMALAAALCTGLVWRLTQHRLASVSAGLLLGLAHMSWWLATVAEVYTWSLALLMLELLWLHALLVRPALRTLCWLALTAGVALSVHNFALLSLPVWGAAVVWLVWRRQLPVRGLMLAFGCWVAGASPYLSLVAGSAAGGMDGRTLLQDALCSTYQGQVLGLSWPRRGLLLANAGLFALSLASPLWVAAVAGWRVRRQVTPHAFRVCLGVVTGLQAIFFVRYFVPDQATFCLPTLGMLSIWAGLGVATWCGRSGWSWWRQGVVVGGGLACLCLVPVALAGLADRLAWQPARARALPFREEARYWLLPWKHQENSAERFARAALAQCGSTDVIYADSTAAGPLGVMQLRASCPSLAPRLVTYYDRWTADREAWQAFLTEISGCSLYLVSPVEGYLPAGMSPASFTAMPTGVLYRVVSAATAPNHHPHERPDGDRADPVGKVLFH